MQEITPEDALPEGAEPDAEVWGEVWSASEEVQPARSALQTEVWVVLEAQSLVFLLRKSQRAGFELLQEVQQEEFVLRIEASAQPVVLAVHGALADLEALAKVSFPWEEFPLAVSELPEVSVLLEVQYSAVHDRESQQAKFGRQIQQEKA